MNIVRPFTYAHGSKQQNYSNAGMPLAHPMGANFMEVLGIVSYSHKEFSVAGKFVVARYGLDPNGQNYGQNINRSYISRDHEYENYLFQGVATNLIYAEVKAAYKLNLAFPVRFELLAGLRSENNVLVKKKGSYIQLGLSLPLWRTYRDY